MLERGRWYVGRSGPGRYGWINIEVLAELYEDKQDGTAEAAQLVIPKDGTAELRHTPAFKASAWLLLQVGLQDRHGSSLPRVIKHRRLSKYEDFSPSGSVEAARRVLVEDGWQRDDAAGEWTFRVAKETAVHLTLIRGPDGRCRTADRKPAALAAWRYDPACVIDASGVTEGLRLYDDESAPAAQIGTLDWSNDSDYVRKVVEALARTTSGEDPALRELSTKLRAYSDGSSGRISSVRGADVSVLSDLLRARKLADRLSAEQDLLKAYYEAVRTDPDVRAMVEAAAAVVALTERPILAAAMAAESAADLERERGRQEAQLKCTVRELEASVLGDLEQRLEARHAEIAADLTERERRGQEIASSLVAQRQALSVETAALADRHATLADEILNLEARSTALRSSVSALGQQEAAVLETVDRFTRVSQVLSGKAGPSVQAALPFAALFKQPPRGKALLVDGLTAAVADCQLLSEAGRQLMLEFAVCAMAGEIPFLHGRQTEDFLQIARWLLASGCFATFEADPTVISFDDLWMRPGTRMATILSGAAAAASGKDARTVLAVIARAERSGARFWYPALADRARAEGWPERLLLCVTLESPETEEARMASRGACVLDAEAVLAPGASAVAPILMDGPNQCPSDLAFNRLSFGVVSAVPVLAGLSPDPGLAVARRLARIHGTAAAVMGAEAAGALVHKTARRFMEACPGTGQSAEAKRGLHIVGGDALNA